MSKRTAKTLRFLGVLLFLAGALVALEVDRRIGSGFTQLLAHVFYSSTIEGYQLGAAALMGAGTVLGLTGGLGCRG